MNSIDYVIPMVFPDDKEWEQDLRRAGGRRPAKAVRYRSWGTEHLLVRCIRKNLPFVRDIVILLARASQVQPWMETEDVRVVYHLDFMPMEHLPTFNSRAMEMFLHRIPGIGERFLYANDDMFPLSPLEETDFFRDGKPCQRYVEKPFPESPGNFHRACLGGLNFVAREFGKHFSDTWLKGGHSVAPILKETCRELWAIGERDIVGSLSPFRKAYNFNQYIYGWRQHFAGNYVDHVPKRAFLSVKKNSITEILEAIRPDAGIVCINDHEVLSDHTAYADAVRQAIERTLT